jgi:hypothetical protein
MAWVRLERFMYQSLLRFYGLKGVFKAVVCWVGQKKFAAKIVFLHW